MQNSHRSTASTVSVALLAVLVIGLPLARGGVDGWTQLAACVVAAGALFLAASSVRPSTSSGRTATGFASRGGSVPVIVAVLGAATLAIAVQLLPLPPALVRLVSPGAADLFESTLRPIGLWPAARPLSLDPPETARELAKALVCLAALAASARLAASRRRADLLLGALAASGAVVAIAGLAAALFGLGPLLEPKVAFVNPNHLSGFLELAAFVALGFALRDRGERRALWLLAFAVSGGGVFLSLSRGGIAAFFVGAAAFALLYVRRARLDQHETSFVRLAAIPVAVSTALAVAAWLAFDPIIAEMRTVKGAASEAKVEMWPIALSMIRRFPLTGIGRGAFAIVFPAYKVEPSAITFTHLENEWLQPFVELGVPAGLLLVGGLAWTWLRAARAIDLSRPEIGALAGTAALAAHDLFDFSLELLGVAVPFAIALGVLARSQPALPERRAALRAAAAVAGLAAILGIVRWRAHPTDTDAMRVAGAATADETVALALEDARQHPADYLPHAAAGVRLVQENRCAAALPWLTRAMALNPTAFEPHRYAARCLAAAGQDPLAKREYRLAISTGDPDALGEAVRRYRDVDDLLGVVPDAPGPLLALAGLLAQKRPADAERVYRLAWESYHEREALGGLARAALAQGKTDDALTLARELEKEQPASPQGYLVAFDALRKLERPDDAKRELELGAARVPGSPAVLVPLAELALSAHHFAEAHRLAQSIVAHEPGAVASKRCFVARVLLQQGRAGEAVTEAAAARDALPLEPWTHVTLSDAYAAAGRYDDAIASLEAAAALPASHPDSFARRLDDLRAARDAQRAQATRNQILGTGLDRGGERR